MPRRHLLVKGRVQGIGFRWFVQETAERLALAGWVRNLPDGSVEAEAEGDPKTLDRFVETVRSGHPWAKVEALTVSEKPEEGERTFRIR